MACLKRRENKKSLSTNLRYSSISTNFEDGMQLSMDLGEGFSAPSGTCELLSRSSDSPLSPTSREVSPINWSLVRYQK